MALSEKELLDLKKELQEEKEGLSEMKGEYNSLMKRLEKDWGIKNLKQAKQKILALGKEVEDLDAEIKKKTEALETTYLTEE